MAELPLSEGEKGQLSLNFLMRSDRFYGVVEVTSSNPMATEKLLKTNRKEIGGRPAYFGDSQPQPNPQGGRRPNRGGHQGRGGRPYERKNSGQGRHYPEGRQESEVGRHESHGEKRQYHKDSRKSGDSYRKDSTDSKPREDEARKPIRNENPEYKLKAAVEASSHKPEPSKPKSNPFGSAKPISTREKDIEYDIKAKVPIAEEPHIAVEVPRHDHPPTQPKPKPVEPQKPPVQQPKEEVKQVPKRPAWGNPDETREIFQINHKKVGVKAANSEESSTTDKPEDKPAEAPIEQHHSSYRNSRGNFRGKRRGSRPFKK